MTILEQLKKRNRTLLEMHLGILFYGLVCQVVGAFFVQRQVYYAVSLWFGILLAGISAVHMYRTLNRALGVEQSAAKTIFGGYIIRYITLILILLLVIQTEVMNPLIVFLAYMSLKVTALVQPITHRLCNKIFHETDPVPEALPDETANTEVMEEESSKAEKS